MGESLFKFRQRFRWRTALRAAIFVALGAASLPAAAEPLRLYRYKENGMVVHASQPPEHVEYSVVYPRSEPLRTVHLNIKPPPLPPGFGGHAAPTAAAGWASSCKGVSRSILDERATPWEALVTKHAKAHGVPAALVRAVMRVESCFDRNAVSRSGARGLMQLMPDTAAQLGVRDSFDADQNIAGGARYLSQLLARFKNDKRLAIAAYNAGPSAVDTHRGIPPFPETRSYVERVLAEYLSLTRAGSAKSSS